MNWSYLACNLCPIDKEAKEIGKTMAGIVRISEEFPVEFFSDVWEGIDADYLCRLHGMI